MGVEAALSYDLPRANARSLQSLDCSTLQLLALSPAVQELLIETGSWAALHVLQLVIRAEKSARGAPWLGRFSCCRLILIAATSAY